MPETKQNPVKKHIEYFSKNQDIHIITSDGQLADESSFDLFNKSADYIPVIVINNKSNDEANAIEINSQNYLSNSEKNSDSEKKSLHRDILQVLLKNSLSNNQTGNILKFEEKKKTRLLVKRGVAHIALLLMDIALIYTKDKLVYVIDHDLKKYSIDKTLTQLEEELDHAIFFRANRQYIVNLNFIKSFKAYQKVKLLVDMNIPELEEPVIISQLVAPAFKKWMNDA